MAQIISEVVYKTDTSDLSKADRQLKKLAKSGDKVKKNVDKIDSKFNSMGKSALKAAGGIAKIGAAAGAAAAGGMFLLARSVGNNAQQLVSLSKATGTSIKQIQILQQTGRALGVSTDRVNDSIREFSIRLSEARTDGGEAAEAFELLGVNLGDLNNLTTDQALRRVINELNNLDNARLRESLGDKIFGGSFEEFNRIVNAGTDKMDELQKRAERLGLVMSDKVARSAAEANEKFNTLFDVLKQKVMVTVAGQADRINSVFEKMLDNLPELVSRIEKLAYAFGLIDELSRQTRMRDMFNEILDLESKLKRSERGELADGAAAIGKPGQTGAAAIREQLKEKRKQYAILTGDSDPMGRLGTPQQFLNQSNTPSTTGPVSSSNTDTGDSTDIPKPPKPGMKPAPDAVAPPKLGRLRENLNRDAEYISRANMSDLERYRAQIREITNLEEIGKLETQSANRARRNAAETYARNAAGIESLLTPQEQYNQKQNRLNKLLELGVINQNQHAEAINKAKDALAASQGPWEQYLRSGQKVSEQLENTTVKAFKGMEDALVSFVKTGKMDFKSLADSIISDLMRIAIRSAITNAVGGSLFGGIGGIFSGFFGGGGGGALASVGGVGGAVPMSHSGGTVGMSGQSRHVDMSMFAGAPRYHNGGTAGLRPNEVPTILERGEKVIPKHGGSGDSPIFNISVNVDASGNKSDPNEIANQTAGELERRIKVIVNDEMRNQRRPGGTLNPTRTRAF